MTLLEVTVNRVLHLDANRAAIDTYNVGWKTYLAQRETDEKRRKRERANAEKQASVLMSQADKMRAKATKAKAAQDMQRRAERLLSGLEVERRSDKVAKLRFPEPAPCGRTPIMAEGLSKSYGSLEVFTDVDAAVDKGTRVVILGLNGAGKTTLLRILGVSSNPTPVRSSPATGSNWATTRRSTRRSTPTGPCWRTCARPGELADVELRKVLGSFLFTGDDVDKPAKVLSGGEKTRLALATLVLSAANVLLLDEPTNNLDPVSREQVLSALRSYSGAIVLVTHDEGAVEALRPDRVILLPDGVEDAWSDEFSDLVALA
ncbi:ATP-binding cassette domain-containing protein [Streptosporangium lutulentum]